MIIRMRTFHIALFFSLFMTAVTQAQEAAPAAAETPAPPTEAVPAAPPSADPNANTTAAEDAAEKPAEVPAARKPLILKSTKTARFNKPTYFETQDSGVILPNPEIEYDLTLDGGKTLQIGNLKINDKTFVVVLKPLASFNPQLASMIGKEASELSLVLRWPEPLLDSGTLEMISRSGTVLWRYDITKEERAEWKKQVEGWKTALKSRGVAAKVLRGGLFATQFAITDLADKKAPFWNQNETFRFCLTQAEGKAQTRLCSQRYQVRTSGKNVVMGKINAPVTPRVVVMNETGPLKGVVSAPADAPSQFYADLVNGESYEFLASPAKLDLMDLSDTTKAGTLRVSGFGVRPTNRHIILNPDKYGTFTTMLGFEPTITDTRKFWAAAMPVRDAKLYFPGEGGGVFRQRFELSNVPRSGVRVHLDANTPKGTYADGVVLRGRKQPNSAISSEQYSTVQDARDPSLFTWSFKASEPAEINRSYFTIEHEGQTYKSFYELYRAYSNEISGRFTGILASGGTLFMGEVAYNKWFENWFGWESQWLTKQRWGMSFKYFKSLTQLPVGTNTKASLDSLTLDAKYRFTPGLWTRDESHGAMFSYQSVTFDSIKAPMLGVGWFWARSMPRVFDNLFNYLPFMNYPKWVDMEFIYYASSMSSDVTLNGTMALNFHGQVLWKENIFGEAGFGLKRYGFRDAAARKDANLNTFYGTFGLGMKF